LEPETLRTVDVDTAIQIKKQEKRKETNIQHSAVSCRGNSCKTAIGYGEGLDRISVQTDATSVLFCEGTVQKLIARKLKIIVFVTLQTEQSSLI
jgi:hypothetical protein